MNPSGPHGNKSKDMPNTRYLKLNMSQMVKVDESSMDTIVISPPLLGFETHDISMRWLVNPNQGCSNFPHYGRSSGNGLDSIM